MQVGFVGLGTMGGKMAANLQKAGYRLVVHDSRRDAATPHLAARCGLGRHAPAGRRGRRGGVYLTSWSGRSGGGHIR